MSSAPPDQSSPTPEGEDEAFQLSPKWLVVGLLMVALGIVCGLVMSSATLFR